MEQIEKKKRSKDEILEILVVVLLGLTALLTLPLPTGFSLFSYFGK